MDNINRSAFYLIAVALVAAVAGSKTARTAATDTIDELTDTMTIDIDDGTLAHPNVRAFLRMIRAGEGTAGSNGYRMLFGGALFDSYDDHPRVRVTRSMGGKPITSTAAGAYQILERTWNEVKAALALSDFTPPSQDRAAVFLIRRRGALADVMAGRFDEAVRKTAKEWASLPGSPYGQPTKTLAQARSTYAQHGGTFA